MRKIIFIFVIAFAICSCTSKNNEEVNKIQAVQDKYYSETFKVIEIGRCYDIVYDVNTKVEYAVSNSQYNRGTFVMLVDENGFPKIYHEDVEVDNDYDADDDFDDYDGYNYSDSTGLTRKGE